LIPPDHQETRTVGPPLEEKPPLERPDSILRDNSIFFLSFIIFLREMILILKNVPSPQRNDVGSKKQSLGQRHQL
jgi:hypothetical protein